MAKKLSKTFFIGIFLLVVLFMSLLSPKFSSALETGQATIIATKCNLLSSPDFEATKVTILDEEEQPVLITLKRGDSVEINSLQDDFAFVKTTKGVEGWIYKFYLTQNSSQDIYPVFNGTILKDTVIFDVDKTSTGELALAGTRVYLYEGFDNKKDYTAVQIALADSTLFTGYISTADIEPDGISKMLIVAITVIVAATTIVLSILFIKKKKKKKSKNKS